MARDSLQIYAVGDICPGEHYFSFGHGVVSQFEQGTLQHNLASIKPYLTHADILIGNLEGPISNSSKHSDPVESRAFRGKPEFASWLKTIGFSHISIANNHIMQHGVDAALESIDAVRRAGIIPIGLRDPSLEWFCKPERVQHNDVTIGILAYSFVTERYEPTQEIYADGRDPSAIKADIQKLKKEADVVLVYLHAGDEGLAYPSEDMKQICKEISDASADIILAHHSHTVQGVESNARSVIFYSLGNFIFDMAWDKKYAQVGIADIQIQRAQPKISHTLHILEKTRQGYREISHNDLSMPNISPASYQSALENFEKGSQLKKIIFFVTNFHRGETRTKLNFILSKIKKRFYV